MTESVIVALITGGVAFLGTAVSSNMTNSKTTALITYRLEQLENKVTKHNNLVERMTAVERDIKTVFHQLDEVKSEIKSVEDDLK